MTNGFPADTKAINNDAHELPNVTANSYLNFFCKQNELSWNIFFFSNEERHVLQFMSAFIDPRTGLQTVEKMQIIITF